MVGKFVKKSNITQAQVIECGSEVVHEQVLYH